MALSSVIVRVLLDGRLTSGTEMLSTTWVSSDLEEEDGVSIMLSSAEQPQRSPRVNNADTIFVFIFIV